MRIGGFFREVCRWLQAHYPAQDAFPFGARQVNIELVCRGSAPYSKTSAASLRNLGGTADFVRPDFMVGTDFLFTNFEL